METTKTFDATYLGKCRSCKCAACITAKVTIRQFVGDYGRSKRAVTIVLPHGVTHRTDDSARAFALCFCGKSQVEFRRILGRVTEHKCGSRCRSSTSGVCECACGGKNHGSAYSC